MSKKAFWIIVLAVVLTGVIFLWFRGRSGDHVIGVILPLTGPVSEDGQLALAALKIAEDGLPIDLKLVYEDGKYDPKTSMSCYQRLMAKNPLALMILGDVPNFAMSDLVKKDKVVDLALVTCDQTIIGSNEWMFAGWFPLADENDVLGAFAAKELGVKRIAVLRVSNNFGEEAFRTFKSVSERYGIEIVCQEQFGLDNGDTRSQVAKILSFKPDAIYVAGFGQGYISAFNTIFNSEYKGYLLSNTAISIDGNKTKIYNKAKGVYYVDTSFDEAKAESTFFSEQFKARTGEKPSSTFAMIYELGKFLAASVAESQREKIPLREVLSKCHVKKSLVGDFYLEETGRLVVPLMVHQL